MIFFVGILGSFILTELIAWGLHRYLYHGPLWFIHQTHHLPSTGFFELNDIFSLIPALVAIWMIISGLHLQNDLLFSSGIGLTLYGLIYYILHDLIIHKRVKNKWNPGHSIYRAFISAHRIHHKHLTKHPSVHFGLFLLPLGFVKTFLSRQKKMVPATSNSK